VPWRQVPQDRGLTALLARVGVARVLVWFGVVPVIGLGTRRWGFSPSGATVVADGSHRLLLAQPGAGPERLVEAVRLERLADLGDHLDLACE
jgi:hypothetical protein